ncbi:MAG: DUF1934 domain-containing protein [Ruminococcaceae bacterium]|nr:DUF1934 domain-containing protein [Oscillospiraceae bacterium]
MKCKIKTVTRQREDKISLFDDTFSGGFTSVSGTLDAHDIDTITSYYEGDICVEGDEVKISYVESGGDMEGVNTTVSYSISNPDELTISREGEVNAIMLFSRGKRTISIYQTPFMPFEIGIYTSRIKNEIMDKGTLELSYIIEIKGALAQKTELKMEIKKI